MIESLRYPFFMPMSPVNTRLYSHPEDLPVLIEFLRTTRPAAWINEYPRVADLREAMGRPSIREKTGLWFTKQGKLEAFAYVLDPYNNLVFEFSPDMGLEIEQGIVNWALTCAIHSVENSIDKQIHSLVAIGGGAASDLWCHILADVTGKNICIPENAEASGLGAAIAAAVGSGWYASFQEAANAMTRIHRKIKPKSDNYKKYQELFPIYKKLYPCLKSATDRVL